MAWFQKQITLAARPRGFHLVTDEVLRQLPELSRFRVGVAHVFIQHTSASLTLNENASPAVRADLERYVRDAVPDATPYFAHTDEGPDDMPAHVKASLFGSSVTVPIRDGRLALGTWQGLTLGEHREDGGPRRLVVTLSGERDEGK
jgi:secondary thiamine-phosphate synthase enzyme